MAYTKILIVHDRLDKSVSYIQNEEKTSLCAVIDYAMNRDKTENTCFETAVNCDLETVYRDMAATKRRWGKASRIRKGYHIIQSFPPGEVTPEEAHAIGTEFALRLLGDRYEAVVTTHLDKAHLHNHVVFNSVSFVDGMMYRDQFRDYFGKDGVGIRGTSDAICREHGLSVIEPDRDGGKDHVSRGEWEAAQKGRPHFKDTLRRDIDAALSRAFTYRSFLQELQRMGYEVKSGPNITHTAVRPPGGKKFHRLDSLGAGYTEADIQNRIAAARSGNPLSPAMPDPFPVYRRLEPGRRYRVHGGVQHTHRPRKLTGFQILYLKYLYLLRGVQRGRPQQKRTAFSLRQEVARFDRYQRQFLYLHKNRIETAEQLSMQYDALQAEIDALTDQRRDLYIIRRSGHGGEAVTAEIERITTRLRTLRRDLKLCVRIEGDIPTVKEAVKTYEYDRNDAHEKTDKSRPDRHFEAGAGVPTHRPRKH